jgi:hypothetical protein
MIMTYAVYVNYPTNRATIHTANCHKYRKRKREKTANGHWKASFASLEDAQAYASGRGREVRFCAFCIGETADEMDRVIETPISETMYTRIEEFKQVIEAAIEEEIDFDVCVELLLGQGIDSMLTTLLGSGDPITLLRSFQRLGSHYPAQVYGYVAEALKQGAIARQQEEMRRMIGFPIPEDVSSEA